MSRTLAGLDPATLQSALDGVHHAGVPGVYAEVRDADQVWRGASGVADVRTGHPIRPDMRQRVGSITKTFTAAAILQQVEQGRIQLDARWAPAHRVSGRVAYRGAALADVRGAVRPDRPATRLQRLRHVLGVAIGLAGVDRRGPQPLLRQASQRRDRELVIGHGTFWGHDGTVWGAATMSMTRADGRRQMSIAVNLARWNRLDASGKPQHHPIDDALATLRRQAMCGTSDDDR